MKIICRRKLNGLSKRSMLRSIILLLLLIIRIVRLRMRNHLNNLICELRNHYNNCLLAFYLLSRLLWRLLELIKLSLNVSGRHWFIGWLCNSVMLVFQCAHWLRFCYWQWIIMAQLALLNFIGVINCHCREE